MGVGFGYIVQWLQRSPVVFLPALLLTITGCDKDKDKPGAEYKGPIETVYDVGVKYSELGKLKVLMTTPKSLGYSNQDKVFPDSVNIDFFSPEGSMITHLRADSGRFDHTANVYVVMGRVKVNKVDENKTLTTNELRWSPVTRKVFTEKPVVVRDYVRSEVTNAVGMDADQDFSHIVFRKATGIYKFTGP